MISFTSVENFFEECTTGIEFVYEGKWYLIEFDDPFSGIGKVRIHLQDEDGMGKLTDVFCDFPYEPRFLRFDNWDKERHA